MAGKLLLTLFVALFLVAAVPPNAQPDQPQQLFLAPLNDEADALRIQASPGVPLDVISLDEQEWVLTMAPADVVAKLQEEGMATLGIGETQPGQGALYLIEHHPWDEELVELPDLNKYGILIWQRGPYSLLQTNKKKAAKLSQLGVRLYPLDEPIRLISRALPLPPPPTAPDPVIAAKMQALTAADIEAWDRRLSGEEPVEIGERSSILRSRFSRSRNGRLAEQYVFEQLQAMGYDPSYFPYKTPYGHTWRDIIIDIPGKKEPERLVLLVGHLDSISYPIKKAPQIAPGADDNGSGSSSLLAIAELLRGQSFDYTLRLVWFTGEEFGYWGSKPYVRELAKQDAQVVAAINMDMTGYDSDKDRVVELHTGTKSNNKRLGDHLVAANDLYDIGLILERKEKSAARFSDHRSFWNQGYTSVMLIENFFSGSSEDVHGRDRNPAYHKQADQVNLVDFNYVAGTARMALAAAMYLASPTSSPALTPTPIPTPTPTVTPPPPSPTPTATPAPTVSPPATCTEVAINGGFENKQGWRRRHSAYVTAPAHEGSRSLRLGLLPRGFTPETSEPNMESQRRKHVRGWRLSRVYQTISLPKDATAITLTFWYRPGTDARRGDRQRVMLLRPRRYTRIKTLMNGLENDRTWKQARFDLSQYAGRKVVLYFDVYNNRTGPKGRTWMFLDDVSVQVCRPGAQETSATTP